MDPVESLSAEAKACLDAFRREVPSAGAADEGWRALEDRLRGRPTAQHSSRGTGRVVIVAAAILAAAAVAFLFVRSVTQGLLAQAVQEPGASEAVDRAEAAEPRDLASRSSREAPQLAEHPASSDPPPVTPPPKQASSRAPPSTTTATQPVVESPTPGDAVATSLAEETRLIEHARAALTRDATNEALSKLLEHAERFPNGTFVEERMAYMAIARCRAIGSRQEARAFVDRWPRSPHRPRVERECGRETSTESARSREQGVEPPP